MAAAIRWKFGGLTRKFVNNTLLQNLVKQNLTHRVCFHVSSCLNVTGQEIRMPSLSPTMAEGIIVKWLKKEGDAIAPGDVLCEIQTDKAVMSFETEEEGILAKILVPENVKDVKVGTLIALMVAEGEDWKDVEIPSDTRTLSEDKSSPESSSSGGNIPGLNIHMPSLSPTMTVGTIVTWNKKEGDKVSPGDVLCDIQTDKAVMSFETEEEGILAKILIPAGTADVKVGTLIALMVGMDEDWKSVQIPSGAAQSTVASVPNESGGGSVPGLSIIMPSLSPTMTEGTIVKWYKKEGDPVVPGDVLCDIQTDKAVMSFETEEEGILAKILFTEGSTGVKVGTLIALMVSESEDWKNVMIPIVSAEEPKTKPAWSTPSTTGSSHHKSNYGPAVRTLIDLYQLNDSQIAPTGRHKKLLKSDVLNYITEKKLLPKTPLPVPLPTQKDSQESRSSTSSTKRPTKKKFTDIELSSMRKTIAKRLTESKMSIPHAYASVECDIDLLLSFRKQLKSAGVVVSVNDFIIKAVAMALKECPLVNCLYVNGQVVPAASIDISIAVATDAGLITPIIKNANVKSIDEISNAVKDLSTRARAGKLQLHEFQGGSFTISNLGMFGISEFSAIINPPQCGILAVGGGRTIIDYCGKTVTKMISTLSFDARAISESATADFLEMLQLLLENPANLLMGSAPKKRKSVAN